jgi:cell wall-associated NlpC family hydrolase
LDTKFAELLSMHSSVVQKDRRGASASPKASRYLETVRIFASAPALFCKRSLEGDKTMRHAAVASLYLALLSVALLASSPSRAEAQTATDQAIVEEARSWIGTPYGAYGADCSGFTSLIFQEFGVYLLDSPAYQSSCGVPSYGEAGDLVFFDEGGYGISHVGIATGYGTVIHASTYYGAVVETPFDLTPGYVGAADFL